MLTYADSISGVDENDGHLRRSREKRGEKAAQCESQLDHEGIQVMLPPLIQSGGKYDLQWNAQVVYTSSLRPRESFILLYYYILLYSSYAASAHRERRQVRPSVEYAGNRCVCV